MWLNQVYEQHGVTSFSDEARRATSLQTDKLRKQGIERLRLFQTFLAEHPDIDLSDDMQFTPEQGAAWDSYAADMTRIHTEEIAAVCNMAILSVITKLKRLFYLHYELHFCEK